MIFPVLIKGKLLKRYKRFLSDIELENGEIVIAHCPNTGSMTQCKDDRSAVLLSISDNPKRKLKYTWEFVKIKGFWSCINTHRANQIVKDAIASGFFKSYNITANQTIKQEVKYGTNSRIDLLVDEEIYIEIKNVTLTDGGSVAIFPDSITKRGLKHLHELETMVKRGKRAIMIYLVQRGECTSFKPAEEIDPKYAKAFYEAQKNGVEMIPVSTIYSKEKRELVIKKVLKVIV